MYQYPPILPRNWNSNCAWQKIFPSQLMMAFEQDDSYLQIWIQFLFLQLLKSGCGLKNKYASYVIQNGLSTYVANCYPLWHWNIRKEQVLEVFLFKLHLRKWMPLWHVNIKKRTIAWVMVFQSTLGKGTMVLVMVFSKYVKKIFPNDMKR